MKLNTFLILLITFAYCLSIKLNNGEIKDISLDGEMNRKQYPIKLNQNYKIINRNRTYKYFFEINE